MNKTRLLALLLVLVLVVSALASCGGNDDDPKDEVNYQPVDYADVVERTDYTSVYEMIGSKVTIDMVEENADGLAFVTVDGVKYELGMDFLSMAMVYNTQVPANSEKYTTEEQVYNEWYKLYIVRWNYLVAEVPLYANEYYDLYNAKIEGFVTSPYWQTADAIVAASIKAGNANSVILGSSTELSGAFRNSSWGKTSPGSADLDIENLTTGYSTLQTNMDGAYVYNMNALAEEPTMVENADGSKTFTIKIKSGLKFSDGTEITAKNYIASTLANSTDVVVAAGGSGSAGMTVAGFDAFNAYKGGEVAEGASRYFEGVQLIDDYTFAVTIIADYAQYYYAFTYAAFSPVPMALYLGDNDIIVDPETKACGLSDGFYAEVEKNGAKTYAMAETIVNNLKWNSNLPYSGPYVVSDYDESALIATLTLNPNYTEDVRGKASIQTITYIKVETATQMDKFTNGEVDVVAGVMGAAETKAALDLVASNPTKYAETHYARAGYGKLGFRGDYGPTEDIAVRQAIMYTLNRPEFAQTFTGGYGAVVHGPYYTGYSAYKAVEDEIILNQYAYSADSAIAVLEEAGWVYNVEGKDFVAGTDDVRYKKLSGYEMTAENLQFATVDGKYKTVKIAGEYYMPLAINWYGTQPNDVTDQLITAWQANANATTEIGMYITYTSCDFVTGLYGELMRDEGSGYNGVPKLNAINFATGFTSTIYDYAFYWTIDPELFPDYSDSYLMDEADFWENYFAE